MAMIKVIKLTTYKCMCMHMHTVQTSLTLGSTPVGLWAHA